MNTVLLNLLLIVGKKIRIHAFIVIIVLKSFFFEVVINSVVECRKLTAIERLVDSVFIE